MRPLGAHRGRWWRRGIVAIVVALGVFVWLGQVWTRRAGRIRSNVLLVTIDTLRPDRLGCYGYASAKTPAIDALAARGLRFETAIAHAPLTGPSHASILTGLLPPRHGVRDNGTPLAAAVPTLGERFEQDGYATAAFVSGFPLMRRFGFARGFSRYDDALDEGGLERRADRTVAAARRWIEEQSGKAPWFVWLHLFDPHAPYDPPPSAPDAPTAYDREIAFADAELGSLLATVDRLGATSRTVVALTADHGESLGEHGEETHGVFVYESTIRVPLIVAGPGFAAGAVAPDVAQSVDIFPTLLIAARLSGPPGRLDGRPFSGTGRGLTSDPVYAESLFLNLSAGWAPLYAWRTDTWKYIEAPRPELYDLQRDPGETANAFAAHRDRAREMAVSLRRTVPSTAAVPASRDPESSARLRSLGYIAASPAPPATGRDPKDGIALVNRLERGLAQVRSNPPAAIRELTAVIGEDASLTLAYEQRAVARVAAGDCGGAADDLNVVERTRPLRAGELVLRGECAGRAGRIDAALRDLARAKALEPESADAFIAEGRLRYAAGLIEEAHAAFARAHALAPQDSRAALGLGVALARLGRPAEGVRYLEQAVAAGARTPVVLNGLAMARLESGDRSGAIDALRRSLALDPNQPGIARLLDDLNRR